MVVQSTLILYILRFKRSQELAKELNGLSNDEDSLVQLSEYCIKVAPTYEDDFAVNKQIECHEDLKDYILELRQEKAPFFI